MNVHFPSPIAFWIGSWPVRWYGLSYGAGIILSWLYWRICVKAGRFPGISVKDVDGAINWSMAGIVIGGRLGHVLLYYPRYYWSHPLEIFEVWKGGMAFHGGFLGALCALWIYCRRHHIPVLTFFDCIVCGAPLGLFLGRLANFINQEVYGRPSQVPWAVVFPEVDTLTRHPSQLYEAALEGVGLFTLLAVITWGSFKRWPGQLAAIFCTGYGISRWICEYFREPEGMLAGISMGQWYSLPFIVLGGIWYARCIFYSQKN